ncbi:MAG TPA: oligosaccharide flippase family protein, partial [Limnochordia bacterium]
VRGPDDAWKALAVQGMAVLSLSWCALVPAYRDVPFRPPTPRLAWAALRSGWILFVSQVSINVYTAGITLILGLAASPVVVGYYAGAEKIGRAFVGLLQPISQALFPRINSLVSRRHEEARMHVRAWVSLMGLAGLVLGCTLFGTAPVLVRLVLGEGFEPAIVVLRILALLPPLIALSNVFGIQWMLPLGLDRQFNSIVMAAGIAAVLLAWPFARAGGHLGAAIVAVATEAVVTAGMLAVLSRKGLNPLARGKAAGGRREPLGAPAASTAPQETGGKGAGTERRDFEGQIIALTGGR